MIMEEKTGRHYMISDVKRQYTDRVPTTILIGQYCSKMSRYTVREILTDARKGAEAHLAFYDRFQPDSLIIYNDLYLELEAIGCELEFPEDGPSHPKTVFLDDKSKLAGLKVPDPKKDGRLPYFMELCERVSDKVKKTATIGLGHAGPWNLAMHLRGVEQLMLETYDDPEFVHEIMRFTTEVARRVGDTLIEVGLVPSLSEATASCSLISPQIYRLFIKPYHKELCDYFRSKKVPVSLHICGYIDPVMEDILDTGIDILSMDSPSSLKKMVECSNGRVIIIGNVPTSLFATGSRDEMEKAIRDCIDTAAEGSGFILSSGCEIPPDSTEDRIDYYFKYGRRYGREFISSLRERRPSLFG